MNARRLAMSSGEALAEKLRGHGLVEVRWHPLTFGIATLYVGVKPAASLLGEHGNG